MYRLYVLGLFRRRRNVLEVFLAVYESCRGPFRRAARHILVHYGLEERERRTFGAYLRLRVQKFAVRRTLRGQLLLAVLRGGAAGPPGPHGGEPHFASGWRCGAAPRPPPRRAPRLGCVCITLVLIINHRRSLHRCYAKNSSAAARAAVGRLNGKPSAASLNSCGASAAL